MHFRKKDCEISVFLEIVKNFDPIYPMLKNHRWKHFLLYVGCTLILNTQQKVSSKYLNRIKSYSNFKFC